MAFNFKRILKRHWVIILGIMVVLFLVYHFSWEYPNITRENIISDLEAGGSCGPYTTWPMAYNSITKQAKVACAPGMVPKNEISPEFGCRIYYCHPKDAPCIESDRYGDAVDCIQNYETGFGQCSQWYDLSTCTCPTGTKTSESVIDLVGESRKIYYCR